jgi:hypothetical protein
MHVDYQLRRSLILWLAAIGGGAVGYFVGRGSVSNSAALVELSQALALQHRISAGSPVLASAITATAAIIGSTLSVVTVALVLCRTDRREK